MTLSPEMNTWTLNRMMDGASYRVAIYTHSVTHMATNRLISPKSPDKVKTKAKVWNISMESNLKPITVFHQTLLYNVFILYFSYGSVICGKYLACVGNFYPLTFSDPFRGFIVSGVHIFTMFSSEDHCFKVIIFLIKREPNKVKKVQ